MNNLMRKILLRRSVYNFSDTTLKDADLLSILEEGRTLSNVEKNESWHFTAVQNSNVVRMLLDSTGQQTMGRLGVVNGRDLYNGGDLLKNIPMLLVISGSGDMKYAEDAANTLFGSMMLAAEKYNVDMAILKANSPSCGCGKVYDGTFSKTLVEGDGVFAKMLKEKNIKVYNENDDLSI